MSYLKYLGIIGEERGKGKDQRFKVIDQSTVKDIIYELKAGRESEAKSKLKEHLQSHVLFQTLKDEFFQEDDSKTLNELEHFLKDRIPNKNPEYYQKGGEFLIKVLSLATLASLNENEITLSCDGIKKKDEAKSEVTSVPEFLLQEDDKKAIVTTQRQVFEEFQIITPDKYLVHFTGPGMNAKYEIQEEDDLIIIEATIAKIKKKLRTSETN